MHPRSLLARRNDRQTRGPATAPLLTAVGPTPSSERPGGRDHALDLLRAVSLARVVLWHVFAQTWLTWIAAIPVMFFVAGTLLERGHSSYQSFVARRARRLLLPFWFYGAIVAVFSLVYTVDTHQTSNRTFAHAFAWVVPVVDPVGAGWTGGWLSSHLWYLRAYLWIIVLSPLLIRAARRLWLAAAAVVAGVALLEAASSVGLVVLGHGTARILLGDALVYGFFATLGVWYRQGRLHASVRARTIAAVVTGGGALAIATTFGLPSGGVNASYPVELLIGVAWLCGLAAVEKPLRALADRPFIAHASTSLSSRSLTVYLWHPACIVLASFVVTGRGPVDAFVRLAGTIVLLLVAVALTGWVEALASAGSAPHPKRERRARGLGVATIVSTLVVGATIPLLHSGAVSAAPSVRASLVPGIPAPSARAALSDSAFKSSAPAASVVATVTSATTVAPVPITTNAPATVPTAIAVPTTFAPEVSAAPAIARLTPVAAVKTAKKSKAPKPPKAVVAPATSVVATTSAPTNNAAPITASTTAARVTPTTTMPAGPAALSATKLQAVFDGWRAQVQPAITSAMVGIRVGTQSWSSKSANPGVTSKYSPDQPFEAASITKTFTAALVLRDVVKGTISLDDPVPALTGEAAPVPAGLTVRRLLTHTSGLVDYAAAPGYNANIPLTALDAVTLSLKAPLMAGAGTNVSYANSNYLYLGLLVEQADGKSYPQLVSELIAAVGLKNTHLDETPRPGWIGFSSGGIISTADDLTLWGQSLLSTNKVLDAKGLALMTTVGDANLGLGTWPACPCSTDAQGVKRYTAIGHHTADGGMFYFPATGITVVAMFEPTGDDTHTRIVSLASALTAATK